MSILSNQLRSATWLICSIIVIGCGDSTDEAAPIYGQGGATGTGGAGGVSGAGGSSAGGGSGTGGSTSSGGSTSTGGSTSSGGSSGIGGSSGVGGSGPSDCSFYQPFLDLDDPATGAQEGYNALRDQEGAAIPDPDSGSVNVGAFCVHLINYWRCKEGLEPFTHKPDMESCANAEAQAAVEAGVSHISLGCGWTSQASAGGGRGTDGTVALSVAWLPYLIYTGGPSDGHYGAMMRVEPRPVACGYHALDRDDHRTMINYYE